MFCHVAGQIVSIDNLIEHRGSFQQKTLHPTVSSAHSVVRIFVMPIDKSSERVRRMFGQVAPRYDFLNHLLSLGIDHWWRRQTVRLVPPQRETGTPPLPILDVCTGTGDLALAYDRAAGGCIPIVATDFCHEMLAIGRRKAAQAGADGRITFVEADAQSLPLPSDAFQIVCVAFGLRNIFDTDGGLAEMTRVAAPGGRVAVLEFTTPTREPFKTVYGWYFRHVLPRVGQWVSRNSSAAYEYLPASVGEFPQGEALLEQMGTAGLVDLRRYPFTLGVATLYVGTKPMS